MPSLKVVIDRLAPLSKEVAIASVTLDKPEVTVSRERDGRLSLLSLIPKPAAAPAAPAASTAGPSSPSIAPSENSLNRTPVFPPRSGPATPAGSIRGTNYSRAPSVASMTAGFADAPSGLTPNACLGDVGAPPRSRQPGHLSTVLLNKVQTTASNLEPGLA